MEGCRGSGTKEERFKVQGQRLKDQGRTQKQSLKSALVLLYPLTFLLYPLSFLSPMKTLAIPPRIQRSDVPPFVLFILERLRSSAREAYIVGGAIRDLSLGRPATDWDVATSALPGEIMRIFQDRRPFSLKHQTVTVIDSGCPYEVTTFRADPPSLLGDLRRRDFTMNAMAFDISSGEVLDPENGLQDIRARVVRATGDPGERFLEDPVRLLRAVRFSVQFNFRIEPKTLSTMTAMAESLDSVSSERIRDELLKILLSARPSEAFRTLARTGLLVRFLPELLEGRLRRQGDPPQYTIFRHLLETVDRVDPVPILRLAALFHDAAKPRVRKRTEGGFTFPGHDAAGAALAAEVMGRLRFSRGEIRRVAHLVSHHAFPWRARWDDAGIRRLLITVGRDNLLPLLRLRRADVMALGPKPPDVSPLDALERRVERIMKESLPEGPHDLALGGDAVMKILGIPPGPKVGQALAILFDRVIDHPEWNEKGHLTGLLEEMRGDSGTRGAVSSA